MSEIEGISTNLINLGIRSLPPEATSLFERYILPENAFFRSVLVACTGLLILGKIGNEITNSLGLNKINLLPNSVRFIAVFAMSTILLFNATKFPEFTAAIGKTLDVKVKDNKADRRGFFKVTSCFLMIALGLSIVACKETPSEPRTLQVYNPTDLKPIEITEAQLVTMRAEVLSNGDLVALQIPEKAARALNITESGTPVLPMVRVRFNEDYVLVPYRLFDDSTINQLASSDITTIAIQEETIFQRMIENLPPTRRFPSSELGHGQHVTIGNSNVLIGPNTNHVGNAEIIVISELRRSGGNQGSGRTFLAQIKVNGETAYAEINGNIPRRFRAPEEHFLLRHGADFMLADPELRSAAAQINSGLIEQIIF